jgi:hypothetical protein
VAARPDERDQKEETTRREGLPREIGPSFSADVITAREPPPPEEGFLLDERYELQQLVGEGGAGKVFRAHDRALGELVAVKILHRQLAADRSWRNRLGREVRVARAIRHPNVCRVFELGHSNDGHRYITMEFGAGTLRDDLESWARTARPPFSARLGDAQALCGGLAAIHAVGITHRDVTPSNILRMTDGRLVVTDFGLAIGRDDKTTFHGGTPKYMAPEVLGGAAADQRADVWQLGLLLHELLFGRPLWTDDRTALISPLATVSDGAVEHELWAVCASCLSPNAALRPLSAVVVAGAVAAAAAAKPYTRLARIGKRVRALARRPWIRGSILVAALVAAGFVVTPRLLKPPMCRGGAARVASLWDGARKSAARKSFVGTSAADGANAFDRVDRIMSEYVARWTSEYTEACEATHVHAEQSMEVLDLRMACLNEELEGATALAAAFSTATDTIVGNAVQAAANFGDLHRCRDARALRGGTPLPRDEKQREAIGQLRGRLAAIKSRAETGEAALVRSDIAGLEADARALGYCPVIAEALAVKGHVELATGLGSSSSTLRAAIFVGESCGANQAVATAATDLVFPESDKDIPFADQWASLAAAWIQRIGGNPRLESWLMNNLAALNDLRGDRKAAIEQLERAVALKERLLGRDHFDVGVSLGNLGDYLALEGRSADALRATERGLAIIVKWLGTDHVSVAILRVQRGDAYEAAGNMAAAAVEFHEGLAVLDRHALGDPRGGYAHAGLGRLAQRRGDLATALRELTAARALIERTPDRFTLARVEFDLGKAQYTNGQQADGLKLADSALQRYQAGPGLVAERDRVASWIAAHRS